MSRHRYPAPVRSAAPILRTFHHAQFDARALADAKAGRTVSVCLPARNEETTVGPIVAGIRRDLLDDVGLVDEILVVDDHSTDRTADVAEAAGATVVAVDEEIGRASCRERVSLTV